MRRRARFLLALTMGATSIMTLSSPTVSGQAGEQSPLLVRLLGKDSRLSVVASAASEHRLQVLLGVVASQDGRAVLCQRGFRVDAEYFYPASSIKLFAAVAALQVLGELRRETGLPIDERTALAYHPLFPGDQLIDRDASNLDGGRVTVGHELRKIFLVSDNAAFNRLYDLVGQDRLNRSLRDAGLVSARIVHRLSVARSEEQNRRAPRIELIGEGFRHTLPTRDSAPLPDPPALSGLLVGRAALVDGRRVEGPMDFSAKNRISLVDLQRALAMVVRPEVDAGGAGFELRDSDRRLLLAAMSETPGQSRNPRYDPEEYPDEWVKLLLPGLEKVVPREHLRIYNKGGRAYGFSIENAYVVDERSGNGFFLAATLYTNSDGVLNDDTYEYETVADPFLAALGEVVARALWDGGEQLTGCS